MFALIKKVQFKKGATKLWLQIIFVPATKISGNPISISNNYFSLSIETLAHQANYMYIEE